ncbi:hypothetical protein ACRJ4W_37880 [Streptomyces sp. GLT-R25]
MKTTARARSLAGIADQPFAAASASAGQPTCSPCSLLSAIGTASELGGSTGRVTIALTATVTSTATTGHVRPCRRVQARVGSQPATSSTISSGTT